MEAAGTGIGDMSLDGSDLQLLHKSFGYRATALYLEADDTAGAVGEIFAGPFMVGAGFQTAVVDLFNLRMALKELSHGEAVGAVLCHADMETFQTEAENEGVLRGLDGAEVTHELNGSLGDVGATLTEFLRVNNAVVAFVRLSESGELVGMSHPVEIAAVDDAAADAGAMTVHVLGG